MSFKLRRILIFVLVGLLGGCLTPIDFPVENKGGRLVVSGQISSLPGRSIIELGETAKDNRLPIPITGAYVVAVDNEGEALVYSESYEKQGLYILYGGQGIPGRTYHIEVSLQGGNFFESTPEKLPEESGTVGASYDFETQDYIDAEGTVSRQPFILVSVNSVLPTNGPAYLRWRMEETYLMSPTDFPDPFGSIPPPCFVDQNADPQRVVLFNGSSTTARSVQQQIGSRVVDFSFLEKHAFTIYQVALTKEAHEYWRKANILANQVGSIFDSPPAQLFGNIFQSSTNQKSLGYFQAVNETYDRFFIYASDLPFQPTFENCTFDGDWDPDSYPYRCIECTSLRNSSYQRPDWF